MTDTARYEIRPVTADRWDELAGFFGPSGAYSHCWCAWWLVTSGEFSAGTADGGAGNRALLQRRVRDGEVPGLLAYPVGGPDAPGGGPDGRDGAPGGQAGPVGWVEIGPRARFTRVGRSRNLRPGPDDDFADPAVWSVACFWIPRPFRRRGVGTALLDGAVAHAFGHGAAAVEGYPIDTQGTQVPSVDVFTGTFEMFERAGFREVLRRSAKRPVMRLDRER